MFLLGSCMGALTVLVLFLLYNWIKPLVRQAMAEAERRKAGGHSAFVRPPRLDEPLVRRQSGSCLLYVNVRCVRGANILVYLSLLVLILVVAFYFTCTRISSICETAHPVLKKVYLLPLLQLSFAGIADFDQQ